MFFLPARPPREDIDQLAMTTDDLEGHTCGPVQSQSNESPDVSFNSF